MEINYTRAIGNETLLIFLSGWGTTPEVVRHLPLPLGWDYLTIHNYTNLCEESPQNQLRDIRFLQYKQVYIVAWSMGVWAAEVLREHLPLPDRAIAVAGTPRPMDNLYGIPEQIFRGTLEGLDDDNRSRFNRRMCGGKKLLSVYESFAARSTEDLRTELLYVYQHTSSILPILYPWTLAIIGEKDLIIPQKNQQRYWDKAGIPTETLNGVGHYPFLKYSTWSELLHL